MLSFSRELKLRTIEANRAPAKNGHHASLVGAPYYLKFPGGLTTENMNFFPPAQKACPSVRVCNKVYHRFYAGLYILIKKLVLFWFAFNTQNMTNPTIVSPVKMEYGRNFSISGLKMMVKSGLEKIFLKFLHALTRSFLLLNLYF